MWCEMRNVKFPSRAFAFIAAIAVLVMAHPSAAEMAYSNAINSSSWQLDGSVTSCSLEHNVPYYGQAVFRTRAGEASAFYLRGSAARFQAGEAQLVAVSPVWKPDYVEKELAVVGVKQGTRPLSLNSTLTQRMLASFYAGQQIELRGKTWYQHEHADTRLAISSIGFQQTYREYLRCVTALIPRNFDQLKRSSLLFPGGTLEELPGSITQQLDHILTLVKHDEKIRYFYIDGHADSVGDRAENLELSRIRASLVAEYLKRRGIPEEWITLRWHGERYPVASNGSAAGRAKNRRVTVRLERVEEIDVLPLASR